MKLAEFKAFLEGFEHGFANGAPTAEQWQIVKDRLNQVREETNPIRPRDPARDIIGPGRIDWPPVTYLDFAPQCEKKEA